MDLEYNAMIFLLKYSESNTFLFESVTKLKTEKNKIPLSILVSIEGEDINQFQPYCVCLVYEPLEGEKGRLDVLKELTQLNINNLDENQIGDKVQCCVVCKYHIRWMFKLNCRNIDYYGPGRYAVMLVKGSKEQIDKDVSFAFSNQVSNACFEVTNESDGPA